MNQHHISDNFPDCFALLEQEVGVEAMERLRQRQQDELIGKEHFGWGLFLRNRFIHPRVSPMRDKIAALPGAMGHHDDYGSILLEALWLHLNGKQGPEAFLSLLEEKHRNLIHAIREISELGQEQETEELVASVMEEKPTLADVLPLFSS